MDTALSDFAVLLRGFACGLMGITAVVLMRDLRRFLMARLAAFFALAGIAHTLSYTQTFCDAPFAVRLPIMIFGGGGSVVFWAFTRALFDDDYRVRAWHVALWGITALASTVRVLAGVSPETTRLLVIANGIESVCLVGAAIVQILNTRAGDLVEPRRRLRVVVIAAAGGYIGVWAVARLVDLQPRVAVDVIDAACLIAVAMVLALALLKVDGSWLVPKPKAKPTVPSRSADDEKLEAALSHAMTVDRFYREETMSIATLAARLGVQEHRLRRLINSSLGHRNFNAFINAYRLADVKQALADPNQATVPILTIALDAGFGSLGPFNRAFKADTGQTPSAYRRECLARFEIGELRREIDQT